MNCPGFRPYGVRMKTVTIYAEATVPGKAGVSVMRISGPAAWETVSRLCGKLPAPRQSGLRLLRDPVTSEVIDEVLVLPFAERQSYTGEQVCELHAHGSRAVVSEILRILSVQPGLRMAEPGEFTRRALECGRLDLTQVEALGDLIAAETETQRQLALKVFRGALTAKVKEWRRDLVSASALIAAVLDFSEEEDVPDDVAADVIALMARVRTALAAEAEGAEIGERIRDGFEVAIVGRPNVGKSTLLNALARRDVAIVSEVAGTTRDVLEVRMDLRGLPVTVLDTAGVRDTGDLVEGLGVERARSRAEAADLRLFLVEPDDDPGSFGVIQRGDDLVVSAKADIYDTAGRLAVSGLSQEGIGDLLAAMARVLSRRVLTASSAIRARHGIALRTAVSSLVSAESNLRGGAATVDLAGEDIRQALRQLDVLIGRVDLEDVLDVVFSNFCIGK